MSIPEIILITNRYIRKLRTYVIISIFLYLIIFNDLVLSKGGGGGKGGGKSSGKGGGDGGGGGGGGKSTNKGSIPLTSSGKPSSKWVFFYYGVGGSRYCGYLCVFTAVLIPVIFLLICGCAIWKCYRIRKITNAEIEEMKKNDNNSNNNSYYNANEYDEDTNYRPNPSNTQPSTSYYPSYPPPPLPHYPPPTYPPHNPNYFKNNLPGYNNLSPPFMENNYKNDLNQKKDGSRTESFDSMEDVKSKKR